MTEKVIKVSHHDNEWRRDQVRVSHAEQAVELLYWPHAGHWQQGYTARLGLKWATIPTYSRQDPVIIPDVCLLLGLDEMRALRDRAIEVTRLMEEAMVDDEGGEPDD